MPDKERPTKKEEADDEGFEGAYCVANPGHYKWLVSYDATSMYPHIIMQWNISPETKILNGDPETDIIRTYRPDLFYRKNVKGVVPEIVEDIFNQRKYWKNLYNEAKKGTDKIYARYCYNLQLNFKILANSIYGVLGNKHFVFYDIDNAECVTMMGQNIIKFFTEEVVPNVFSKMTFKQFDKMFPYMELTEESFAEVQTLFKKSRTLTDTDSGFFTCSTLLDRIPKFQTLDREGQNNYFRDMVNDMSKRLLEPYYQIRFNKYSESFNTVNKVHFKQEKIVHDQIVFAKKKYVCFILDSEGKRLEPTNLDTWDEYFYVTGLEIKRTDTSKVVQHYAEEVICRIVGVYKTDEGVHFGQPATKYEIDKSTIELKKVFKELPFEEMCLNRTVKNLEKYYTDDPFRRLPLKTPIHNKTSMYFNCIKPILKIQSADITSGTKIRYIYVKPGKNKWSIDSIAWTGAYPEQFKTNFEVDYNLLFAKSVMAIIQRLYTAIGWGDPDVDEHKIGFVNLGARKTLAGKRVK